MEEFKFETKEETNDSIAKLETFKSLSRLKVDFFDEIKRVVNNLHYREGSNLDSVIDPEMIAVLGGGSGKLEVSISETDFDFEKFDAGLDDIYHSLNTLMTMRNNGLKDEPESLFRLRSSLDKVRDTLNQIRQLIDEDAHPKTNQKLKSVLDLITDKSDLLKRKFLIVSDYLGRR